MPTFCIDNNHRSHITAISTFMMQASQCSMLFDILIRITLKYQSSYKANVGTKPLTLIFEYCIHYANLTDLRTRIMAWKNVHRSSQFSCCPLRIKHSLYFNIRNFHTLFCRIHVWHVFSVPTIRLSSFLIFLWTYWRITNAVYLLTYLNWPDDSTGVDARYGHPYTL